MNVTQQNTNTGSFIEVTLGDSTTIVSPEYDGNDVTSIAVAFQALADKLVAKGQAASAAATPSP